jgi:hypothetical protein
MGFIDDPREPAALHQLNTVGCPSPTTPAVDPLLNSSVGFTVYVFTGTDPGER